MNQKKKTRRLSISLDEKSADLVDDLQRRFDTSKAEVMREALKYLKVATENGSVPVSTVSVYLDMLSKGEHVIVDTEHWRTLLKELGENSEDYWEKARKIGKQHWREYSDKGIRSVGNILKYVENANWYTLSKDSKKGFTLILKVQESKKFVKEFFKSLFEASPHEIEINEGYGKIRINVISER